jgi:hypothetical protein
MEANQSPNGKTDKLGSSEWDFRSIPRTEVEACFIYEYARELMKPRLVDLRAQTNTDSSAPNTAAESSKEGNPSTGFVEMLHACFAYIASKFDHWFPDTPWQKLDQSVRSKLLEDLNYQLHDYFKKLPRHKLNIHTLAELGAFNVRSFEIFQLVHKVDQNDATQTEYGFFAINWNYPDTEIEAVFSKWLLERRKGRQKCGLPGIKYKPKGRGGSKDRLNWLGALRVREGYPHNELVNCSDPFRPDHYLVVAAPYSHLPDLYEAAKKADQLLSAVSGFSLE